MPILRTRNTRLLGLAPRVPSKPTKPLAHDMFNDAIDPQAMSPLFSTIPKELRDLIFAFALTAYPDPARPYDDKEQYVRPGTTGHLRIATELLLTCKAIYTECYHLPTILNPMILYFDQPVNIPPHARGNIPSVQKLAPWCFAALRILDISLQQVFLEKDVLKRVALQLRTSARSSAVQPRSSAQQRGRKTTGTNCIKELSPALANAPLVPTYSSSPTSPLRPHCITKLVLRIDRVSWWTWTNSPFARHPEGQLHLDPGFKSEQSAEAMLSEAGNRRSGTWNGWQHPQTWGAQLCASFPDLIHLTLVLETFAAKKAQLDTVVKCAATWTFPMTEGYELRFVGAEESSWKGAEEGYKYEEQIPWLQSQGGVTPNPRAVLGMPERTSPVGAEGRGTDVPDARAFEVRNVRFVRRRCVD